MKDLVIKKVSDSSLVASFRSEMLSNNPSNFEPVEIRDNTGKIVDSVVIAGKIWQKIPYSWSSFVSFCTTNALKIVSSDSNGSNPVNIN